MIAKGTIFVSYQSESKRLNGEKKFCFGCVGKVYETKYFKYQA